MKLCIICALLAFALSFVFSKLLIPVLRKIKLGQNILAYVKEHKEKGGTPTMGGIAFLSATILTVVLLYDGIEKRLIISLAVGIAYMIVGLSDDVLKKLEKTIDLIMNRFLLTV